METIDLIAMREADRLRRFTRETGQPTALDLMDLTPLERMKSIEIDGEHVTVIYNEKIDRLYNANTITHKEWVYKYNDDPEFVEAVRRVIELSRKHLYDLPENVACPPGCAECCSGYEPYVSRSDLTRLANHLGMTEEATLREYVVQRESADGADVGWVRKITDDVGDKCVFLKGTRGRYYCGVYEGRPQDCRDFTPIGCNDVDESLPRKGRWPSGDPFRPRHAARRNGTR